MSQVPPFFLKEAGIDRKTIFAPFTVYFLSHTSFSLLVKENGEKTMWVSRESLSYRHEIMGLQDKSFIIDRHNSFGMGDVGFYPIISLDGYNVMLTENVLPEHHKHMHKLYSYNKEINTEHYEMISAYGLENVDVRSLSIEGYKQFKQACIELELYELINRASDGDFNTTCAARKVK